MAWHPHHKMGKKWSPALLQLLMETPPRSRQSSSARSGLSLLAHRQRRMRRQSRRHAPEHGDAPGLTGDNGEQHERSENSTQEQHEAQGVKRWINHIEWELNKLDNPQEEVGVDGRRSG